MGVSEPTILGLANSGSHLFILVFRLNLLFCAKTKSVADAKGLEQEPMQNCVSELIGSGSFTERTPNDFLVKELISFSDEGLSSEDRAIY